LTGLPGAAPRAFNPPGSHPALLRRTVPWLRFNPLRLMNDNRGVVGVSLGHLWDQHDMIRNWMSQILAWQAKGKITPVVDRSFVFAEAAAAHRHIEGRGNIGKVVLVP
jgi:NADPH:quinone reductase-like Zn-dependent oxidoreductase